MDDILQTFRARIETARAAHATLCVRGGGTKHWYGREPAGDVLDTRAYAGIVAYEPTELVITARCGTTLVELEAALAARGQMLAFEPPHFGAGATVGGMVASGLAGPRRQAQGGVRDYVLGVVMMDGAGQVLRFGGQVMKNVAGYDVSRLMAGSLGTLGLILEVSLKVLPLARAEISLYLEMEQHEAITRLNQWAGQPWPISASVWHEDMLTLRLSGAIPAVDSAVRHLGAAALNDSAVFWHQLREHQHPFFAGDEPLWRIAVPSTTPPLALGPQLMEWGGALRWSRSTMDGDAVREIVRAHGGHATLFRHGRGDADPFHPLAPPLVALHRNVKHAFDPAGIFNRGRMYKEF